MFDVLLARLRVAENQIAMLKERVSGLEDKLDVVEEHTCENYNMIKELNTWKNEVDNRLDQELL
jgi:uncharacterized protein YigA (DUF484 family)